MCECMCTSSGTLVCNAFGEQSLFAWCVINQKGHCCLDIVLQFKIVILLNGMWKNRSSRFHSSSGDNCVINPMSYAWSRWTSPMVTLDQPHGHVGPAPWSYALQYGALVTGMCSHLGFDSPSWLPHIWTSSSAHQGSR